MPRTMPLAATEPDANDIVEMSVVASEIATNSPQVNAYELRNAVLLERKKRRIRYEAG